MSGSGCTRHGSASCLSGSVFRGSGSALYLRFGSVSRCGADLLGLTNSLAEVLDIFQGNFGDVVEKYTSCSKYIN